MRLLLLLRLLTKTLGSPSLQNLFDRQSSVYRRPRAASKLRQQRTGLRRPYSEVMHLRTIALIFAAPVLLATPAMAIELNISPQALERTLNKQLFTQGGRYYFRGKPGSACYAYAEDPKVSFNGDRVVV